MKIKKQCSESTRQKILVFSERRSKLTVNNKDEGIVTKIIVDGCQIVEGVKCDFLLVKKEVEYFIELKGQNISHAIDQISRTITLLSSDARKSIKISFVICTRSPMASPEIQSLKLRFKRDYNSDLIIKSSPFTYSI